MRVLMIAPPGAGKGTQGALIAAHFGIPHIATGELLRDHVARRTSLGLAVQEYLDRGELVPDQVVLDMAREALVAAKAAGGGYVLDGIPRNMQQARAAYLIARELGMTRMSRCTWTPTMPKSPAASWREPPSSAAPTTPRTSSSSAWPFTIRRPPRSSAGTGTAGSWFRSMRCVRRSRSAARSSPRWTRCARS
jgi:hypothetical protein